MAITVNTPVTAGTAALEQLEAQINAALLALEKLGGVGYATLAAATAATIDASLTRISVAGAPYIKTVALYDHEFAFTSADGAHWAREDIHKVTDQLPIIVFSSGQSNALAAVAGAPGDIESKGGVWSFESAPVSKDGWVQTEGWKPGFKLSRDYPQQVSLVPVTTLNGNNFPYHFCARLARETGRPVIHLAMALGGTKIAQHLPEAVSGLPPGEVNVWAFVQSMWGKALIAPLPWRTDGATLAGLGLTTADYVLWHQGEANTDAAAAYASDQAANFVRDTLRVFSGWINPLVLTSIAAPIVRADTPIIMGELLNGAPNSDRQREIRQMAAEVSNLRLAPIGWLPSDDDVHFLPSAHPRIADIYHDQIGRGVDDGWTVTIPNDGLYSWRPSHLVGAYAVSDAAGGSRLHFAVGYRVTASLAQVSPWNDAPGINGVSYHDDNALATLATVADNALGVGASKNRLHIRNRRGAPLTLRITPLIRQPLPGNLAAD